MAAQRRHRRVVDNRAASLGLHDRRGVADAEQHTAQQQVHGVAIVLRRHAVGVAPRWAAGIVEQAVEATERLSGPLDGRLDLGFLSDVTSHETGGRAQRLDHRRALLDVAPGDHHLAALGHEQGHRGLANAAGAAGDQRGLARETSRHGCQLSRFVTEVVGVRSASSRAVASRPACKLRSCWARSMR